MPLRSPPRAKTDPAEPSDPPSTPEAACRSWYEAHGPSVYSYLRFHLPSADLAEDLTAEVFLRALRGFERFDPALGSPKPWLLRIARNALRDHQRQAGRRPTVSLSDLRDLQCVAPSPEERLLWQEEVARLMAAVAELSPKDREILSLCYGSDLSLREVAAVLRLSGSAARTRLWRALGRLRKVLVS